MQKSITKNKNFSSAIKALCIIVVINATLASCSKILDQAPETSPYNQVFWQTSKDALQALSGDYALLRAALTVNNNYSGLGMSHFAYGDLSAGEFNEFNEYAYNFLVKGDEYYSSGIGIADFNGDYLSNLQEWTPHYKTITLANTILEKVPGIPASAFKTDGEAGRNKIIGEALFLKAFSYFYMVRLWGDVPLITKYDPQPGNSVNVPRTSELTVLDTCINDLNRAVTLLDWNNNNASEKNVRAGKGAAFALLAHIYMWKDFLNKGADVNLVRKAVSSIDSVTNRGGYALVPATDYPRLFKGKSEEGIFEINMSFEQNEQQQETGFYYETLKEPYIQGKTSKNGVLDADKIWYLYDMDNVEDKRVNAFFDMADYYDPILIKYCGGGKENVFYRDAANFAQAAVNSNIIIFRLADIKLLRAEANARLGNFATAKMDLNDIRARAGLENYDGEDGDLYSFIIDEKRRELFCEGHTWYDLVRSKLLPEIVERFTLTRFNEEGWKWPVGRNLFLNNNVLIQTKYWQGKVK